MIRRGLASLLVKRGLSNSAIIPSKFKPGTILNSTDEIDEFLSQPSWSVKELLSNHTKDDFQITDETVDKMIKLSGLNSEITQEVRDKIAGSLTQQMRFIRHLYDDDGSSSSDREQKKNKNDTMFRLIASDHNNTKPITLEELLRDIENIPKQVSPEKGETGFNIKKLHPDNESSYFVFKARQG